MRDLPRTAPNFLADDYDEINAEFFNDLRRQGDYLDPSGWLDTASNALAYLPVNDFDPQGFQSYYGDHSTNLGSTKEALLDLLGRWDETKYLPAEVTVCQSATAASVLALDLLRANGVKTILFESPCYFASLDQCFALGLSSKRLPSYADDDFALSFTREYIRGASPCALWITQPRIALGYNQSESIVRGYLEMLSSDDFLVIDEALEQSFPTLLRAISPIRHPQIIKIRSLLKSCGLNGVRLSFVLHHGRHRPTLEHALDRYNPSVDYFSLQVGHRLSQDPRVFRTMLSVANEQTTRLRKRAEVIAGKTLHVHPLVNGYIGSMAIDLGTRSFDDYLRARRVFLEYCGKNRVPVIMGASMSFAVDSRFEYVRLNFFNREHHILDGIERLKIAVNATLHAITQ